MTRFLRSASTKSLVAAAIASIGLMAGGAMVATGAGSNDSKPAPKPLARAVSDSLGSKATFEGVSARVRFDNRLLDASGATAGSDPVMGGGSGRFWADPAGRLRIELQSDGGGGDVQVVSDGKQVWASYGNTGAWKATLPTADRHPAGKRNAANDRWPPSVATVARAIKAISGDATLSEATPDNVGGRPAYTVTISPKDTSGLFAGGSVSWDATSGAPLAIGILAKGEDSPVLALSATEVEFGPVDPSVFDLAPPAGAKEIDLTAARNRLASESKRAPKLERSSRRKPVTGRAAVQARIGFPLTSPETLEGRRLELVTLVGKGSDAGAVLTYGKAMDALIVIQTPEKAGSSATANGDWGDSGFALPTERISGVEAVKLGTPLGSVVSFARDGVRFTVLGSVTAGTVTAAASRL